MSELTIRTMRPEEAEWAVQQAAVEGWNPGLADAPCFYRTDPAGFFIAHLENRPVGCISAVSYAGQYGFLGFYIVLAEYRRKGYGHQLWQTAREHLAGHTVGLDGVIPQVPVYAGLGFHQAYRSIRFEGRPGDLGTPDPTNVVSLDNVPFETVRDYDRLAFPADRSVFLRDWLNMPGAWALGHLESGRLTGFGMIRPCRQGYKIGPLLADDASTADKLLKNLVARVDPEGPYYLDVIEPNRAALNLARLYSLREVFVTARMYNGPEPRVDLQRIYGVTTFELG